MCKGGKLGGKGRSIRSNYIKVCIIATVWQSVDCSFYARNLVDKESGARVTAI